MGHVNEIINKCDFLLLPRVQNPKKDEKTCTNFYALYDLVSTYFNKEKILDYNIDNKNDEKKAFINIGKRLGFSKEKSLNAYEYAKKIELKNKRENFIEQNKLLKKNTKKILLVGHPYNIYDNLVGKQIIDFLKENNIDIIYADVFISDLVPLAYNISKDIYWTYNKELLGALEYYKNFVNGIILVSSFPCGPDSLVNDLIIRKVKDIPLINIVLDDLNSGTGLITRLESFVDIISEVTYEK